MSRQQRGGAKRRSLRAVADPPPPQAQEPASGKPLAVFDIDGVLADVRHRLRHVEGRKRWDLFFAASVHDGVLEVGRQKLLAQAEECEIVLLTGRPESERHRTEAWLQAHAIPYHRLLMRPRADRRPARLVKPELLAELARGREVRIVVDDDAQVIAALRRAGWPVLHARWMAGAPRLGRIQEETGRS